VLAEKLRLDGLAVTLITPSDRVSAWTVNTLEQHSIQKRLLELGVELCTSRNVVEFDGSNVMSECTYTGRLTSVAAAAVVTVTARLPNDTIGDCLAPSTIAAAVYAGHRYAREFDARQAMRRLFSVN
jgi:dimethylamine/trimethylamine dehydrogenase